MQFSYCRQKYLINITFYIKGVRWSSLQLQFYSNPQDSRRLYTYRDLNSFNFSLISVSSVFLQLSFYRSECAQNYGHDTHIFTPHFCFIYSIFHQVFCPDSHFRCLISPSFIILSNQIRFHCLNQEDCLDIKEQRALLKTISICILHVDQTQTSL